MIEGIAGGIQPWWHHIGAYHEDRRMYHTAEPVFRWHQEHEQYLVNRRPVASVGVVWSQRNTDYYGRDDAADVVDAPYRGCRPGADPRAHSVPAGERGPHRTRGERVRGAGAAQRRARSRMRNAPPSGVSWSAAAAWSPPARAACTTSGATRGRISRWPISLARTLQAPDFGRRAAPASTLHTYLRLSPELRARIPGPKAGDEPVVSGERHAVLAGFEETDILPFGGALEHMRIDPGVTIPLTFVPPFPMYPPETAWMRAAQDRHPRAGAEHAGKGARGVPGRRPRPPLWARQPAGPRQPAGQSRALGGREPHSAGGAWAGADRLPPVPAARPPDSAPGQPDQRGHLARRRSTS